MKLSRKIMTFIIIASYFCSSAFGAIETVTVKGQGEGSNLGVAINNAIIQAISQVNGKSIESVALFTTLQDTSIDDEASSYYSSDKYQRAILEKVKGSVSSFEILEQEKDVNNEWHVSIRASIKKYKTAESGNRKRIAVMQFRYENNNYQINDMNVSAEKINRLLNQKLVDQLVQTRKFTVLDRDYVADSINEKKVIVSGDSPSDELAKLGQKMVADYIFVGTLENMSYSVDERKMRTSDKIIKRGNGDVDISFRLLDVATQQIMASETMHVSTNDKEVRSLSSSLSVNAITNVMTQLIAEKISKYIHDQIYPVMLISVKGTDVVIGQGGRGLKKGVKYMLYHYGDPMHDPYTKEYLGRQESYAGIIEVTRVTPKLSYGRLINPVINVDKLFSPKRFILRGQVTKNNEKLPQVNKDAVSEAIKKVKKDDDW